MRFHDDYSKSQLEYQLKEALQSYLIGATNLETLIKHIETIDFSKESEKPDASVLYFLKLLLHINSQLKEIDKEIYDVIDRINKLLTK